ncbi:MAG TPA: thioredoxin domain-containing protein [Anaerolineales bacterium]|nr:thioredoxin domain-containing protein [Anaerolineales bacterium]
MTNRLAHESSPYLLQHKDNPVDWYPWGEEAINRAREEGKPIFLSIGYAACHWCHVMEHESFEDPGIADLMNRDFVNIKVDREERPDLDTIYMNAVVTMTGQGGWPMSVFLTPGLQPFFGGTYFPPERRYNMPAFRDVLTHITHVWDHERARAEEIGSQLHERIQGELSGKFAGGAIQQEALERASLNLAQSYDWKNGGWGGAPKFPQPMAIEFLIRRAVRGDNLAASIVPHVLRAMAQGGMYDLVGGGFHRYSVDEVWLVPHFEKMLYDNAQLARSYLHGYILTANPLFRDICTETIDFVIREMSHAAGGFFSSLDADSEGEEGLYYTWSAEEIRAALQDPSEFDQLTEYFEIDDDGNFEGKIILRRKQDDLEVSGGPTPAPKRELWPIVGVQEQLLQARSTRVRPATDDKVLTAWNGLMLVALAEAARYLGRDDYKLVAMRNADFLLSEVAVGGQLKRSWRNGLTRVDGFLEDYAALTLGLLALYQTDPDPRWFSAARTLAGEMIDHFSDGAGAFYDTRDDQADLLFRPRDIQDNATPSGNALASAALLTLAALDGDQNLRERGEKLLGNILSAAERYPAAFAQWLSAADLALGPVVEVAIIDSQDRKSSDEFASSLSSYYHPNLVAARSELPLPHDAPHLLEDRPLQDGQPTAYICEDFVCKQPLTQAGEVKDQLTALGCIPVPS